MAKMNKKWVILCSTAVAAVYGAGYYSTEAQAIKMDSQPPVQVSMHTNSHKSGLVLANNSQSATNTSAGNTAGHNQITASKTTVAAAAQPKQIYKDGTFTGSGLNRRGSIEVAVTLKNDKITDVQISNWGMHYNESDITALPGEVVTRQTSQVDYVSGATYSSQAFMDAVQAAIDQAKNA